MPTPVQSDLHINFPLTNVSIAWMQDNDAYILESIFPKVPVKHQGNVYWKYSMSDWRRPNAKKRAPGTESAGGGWKNDTDNYFCEPYALHTDIDDQTRANADSNWNLDRDGTEFVTNQLLLQRDIDWATKYFKTGVWSKDYVGTTDFVKWSDAGSDPIQDVADWRLEFIKRTGFKPTVMVIGAEVLVALLNHPDIIDRIKHSQKGIVTEDLLAQLFQIPKLVVSYATYTSVEEYTDARVQDAAATYDWVASGKDVLMAYAPAAPSLKKPSAGYLFTWKGYLGGNANGLRVKKFRMEHLESDRIEATMSYDMKVVAKECGTFLSNAVA